MICQAMPMFERDQGQVKRICPSCEWKRVNNVDHEDVEWAIRKNYVEHIEIVKKGNTIGVYSDFDWLGVKFMWRWYAGKKRRVIAKRL